MAKPSSSFLREALNLFSKNPKLFSHVYLIYILSHVLLFVGFLLCITPLVSKLIELTKAKHAIIDVSSPEFTKLVNTIQAVINELLIIETIYYVFLFAISWFLSIITYYANSATYVGEMLTLKDVLNKLKGVIKGPIITTLFVVLSTLVYNIAFAVMVVAIFLYFPNISDISSWFWAILVILFASLLLVYLSIIWSMGIAISVIEPNFYGIGAISRATKLLNGKRKQVFLLTLVLIIIFGIIQVGNAILTMKLAFHDSVAANWALAFVYQILLQVLNWYSTIAITVLYYECKQNGDELEYTKLATASIA
ncbi:polyadenylate-binding protein 1-B-binding protein [Rhynchospora pubera]|uniref:Polyadenylate-binding protein 1-B-binding protein n=1 Tax=Rhynchospora pubera TaxID=906938 RepID=A0AAV8D657_9POAL|nr:polyadenylate-binding protein 1-B-binding protein [Rhynchospora pubera]